MQDSQIGNIMLKTKIPSFFDEIISKLEIVFGIKFNFVTVNEYELGQGIMPHKDASEFGPTILSLGLLEDCEIQFSHEKFSNQSKSVYFPRRSLMQMAGESRTDYFHGISKNNFGCKTNVQCTEMLELQNQNSTRRRVSIVFRTIEPEC